MKSPRSGRQTSNSACLTLGLLALGVAAAARAEKEDFKVVPIQVNVLKGIAVNDAKAKEIADTIVEANKILKQANIKLEYDGAKNLAKDFDDQGNHNDKIESGEDAKLDKAAVEELGKKFGKGKGYKVIITSEIHGGTDTGLSPHNPASPVTYLRNVAGRPATARAQTLAHEFCHVFTLGPGHKIDAATKADAQGHHPTDKKNLMWAFAGGGTALTKDQIAECNKGAKRDGKLKQREGDPVIETVDTRHGGWTDDTGDVATTTIDLSVGSIYADGPLADLEFYIDVAGPHSAASSVQERIEVYIDADHNAGTGGTFGAFSGIDKVLRIDLNGSFPFTAPVGVLSASLLDVASGSSTPLSGGSVARIQKIADVEAPPDTPAVFDVGDSVRQPVPIALLQLSAAEVPMAIRSSSLNSGESDTVAFSFDYLPPPEVHIEMSPLSGETGNTLSLAGTHFTPLSSVKFLVDDVEVMQASVAADGSVAAQFKLPQSAISCDVNFDGKVNRDDIQAIFSARGLTVDHFVTARGSDGRFDFSVFKRTVTVNDARYCTLLCSKPRCDL